MFGIGVRLSFEGSRSRSARHFAMFSYMAEAYNLQTGVALAQCEGSCNSQEKKYRERTVKGLKEATPIADVMNTLQKMAQKRAYVGAIIQATGASDLFTQDIDSAEDADQLGVSNRPEPKKAAVIIPKVTSAKSEDQASAPICCEKPMMVSKFIDRELGHAPFYCMACKRKEPRA
jgi:hypothetical protein